MYAEKVKTYVWPSFVFSKNHITMATVIQPNGTEIAVALILTTMNSDSILLTYIFIHTIELCTSLRTECYLVESSHKLISVRYHKFGKRHNVRTNAWFALSM